MKKIKIQKYLKQRFSTDEILPLQWTNVFKKYLRKVVSLASSRLKSDMLLNIL